MKFLKELIDEERNEENIDYFDFSQFSNLEKIDKRIHGTLTKAYWENRKITAVLKNLNNSKITESDFKEFITKLKDSCKINHSNINHFFGLTRDSNGNYFSVLEYANEGNLRDYLKIKFSTLQWDDKLQIALDITRGLMYLHSNKTIHGNLHAYNVLFNSGKVMLTDFRLFKQVAEATSENIVYIEPQYLRNLSYELDMKSDIYSLGTLLWELSSGHSPFSDCIQKAFGLTQVENKLLNGERENSVANTPSEYLQLYQKCWQDDPYLRPEINQAYEILSQLKLQSGIGNNNDRVTDGKSLSSTDNDRYINKEISDRSSSPHTAKITLKIFKSSSQEIIRQFKLNHGIVLNGYDIMPSLLGVTVEDGELKMNIYEGQPLVYTSINSEDNELKIDTCINFPVVKIVYNGNLLESFLKYINDEKKLRELYGDCFARRVLVGGQLFIMDFNSATPTQVDILKFYLFCIYNSVKYSIDVKFSNLFTLDLLPKLITLDGEKINTHEKLTNWMNNLYKKKMVNIISYDDLIPVSQLKHNILFVDSDLETFKEKQPGVSNFKEKLNLDEWVGNAVNNNLMTWTKDFNLLRGLIINKYDEIEISKEIPVVVTSIPNVNSNNESYLKIIKPSTKLEFTLTSNNIFSIKNLSTFPFIKNSDKSYEGYNYIQVKCEKYEILLNIDNVKPTKEFEQVIEEALNSMKPLKALQDVFNEYGHLFPQRIILGRSLKDVLQNLSTFGDVKNNDEILESLDNLNIPYLLTQKGRIIGKNDLHKWIQNMNNQLEIIEFDNVIPLYKILGVEQKEKIDDILNDNYRIIMTGITDLTDLSNDSVENYKRINFGLSLESEDYEIFGLIISENSVKLEEIYVNFGLYDFNGFYAIIKKLEDTSVDITKCYVSWIVIGNPSQVSVFSPNNRELQVDCIKKSIKLQPDKFNYGSNDTIYTSFTLHEGYTFFAHANLSSISYEPNNIVRLVEWKEKSINVQIELAYKIQSNVSSPNGDFDHEDDDCLANEVDLRICILSTNYKSLKVDHAKERLCPLELIGHILNEENFNESLFNESNKNEVSVNIQNNDSIPSKSLIIQPEPDDKVVDKTIDDIDIEENEKEESNENNVDIQSINPPESHSEEELKKDNNIDVEENEKEENDENHVVVENINSSEYHSEEEEPKKDNNIDVEENENEKNDENNVVENINSSESHSEEQQLKKDEINMNVEENEKEECRKCDDGDSVHSVSEKVILPEIILTHSEDSVVKESNNPNIENIVTVNQVNQINQYIVQNVQNVNNVQQPQQPDDYEGSVFLKTVRKMVKEVENIVDKAAKAHREAVLRSSNELQEELQEDREAVLRSSNELQEELQKDREAVLRSSNELQEELHEVTKEIVDKKR